jgi:hypothetical protein
MSNIDTITCGVPQGSVLGPLLFLIYVNDIKNVIPSEKIKLFADDTNMFIYDSNLDDAKKKAINCINKLNVWFTANKLSLNLTKTCYITFSNKNIPDLNLVINGHKIEKVTNCKYLGLTIDEKLNWDTHINNVYNKIIKFTSIFYKMRSKLPSKILKDLYFAFVYPHIVYGIELYANTHITYLDKLIKLNNKIIRILQFESPYSPIHKIYSSFNTLAIPDLHKFQILLFIHKIIYHPDKMPSLFTDKNYFITNSNLHHYNTRSKHNIHLHNSSSTFGHRNLKYKAAKLWNCLPDNIRQVSSLSCFNKILKSYLLSQNPILC